jgi:hypothetical protein
LGKNRLKFFWLDWVCNCGVNISKSVLILLWLGLVRNPIFWKNRISLIGLSDKNFEKKSFWKNRISLLGLSDKNFEKKSFCKNRISLLGLSEKNSYLSIRHIFKKSDFLEKSDFSSLSLA